MSYHTFQLSHAQEARAATPGAQAPVFMASGHNHTMPFQEPRHAAQTAPAINYSLPTATQAKVNIAAAKQKRPDTQATVHPALLPIQPGVADKMLQKAKEINVRATQLTKLAEADTTRKINDVALEHAGGEMNPRMLSSPERMKIVDWNGGQAPQDWPPYETFVIDSGFRPLIRGRREPDPAWKADYGFEEVMECLDDSED